MKRLTDEQRKLVENNHNLIYSFIKHHEALSKRIEAELKEDAYSIAAIGICNAAATYKPEYGFHFSTYAWRCMDSELKRVLIHSDTKKKIPNDCLISCETEIDENFTILDSLSSPIDVENEVVSKVMWENAEHSLKGRELSVYAMMLGELKSREIGANLGVSTSRAQQLVAKVRNKMRLSTEIA